MRSPRSTSADRTARRFVAELADVRNVVVSKLKALAPLATVPAADGAFYVLLKVETDRSPMRIAEQLIREHGVAVIPGPAFGMTERLLFPRGAYGALQKAHGCRGHRATGDGTPRILVSALVTKVQYQLSSNRRTNCS